MKNKKLLFLSTLLCLLPILLGLSMYAKLPPQVPIHFDMAGNPDNYASRGFAVFGLPLLMTGFHVLLHWAMRKDKKTAAASPAALLAITYWIIPILCNVLMPITLSMALDVEIPIVLITTTIMGILFVIIGNYLPKCKPNRHMGIKLPWTFASKENWRRTHRFGGFVFVAAGIATLIAGIFTIDWLLLTALCSAIILPTVYSWLLSRKNI